MVDPKYSPAYFQQVSFSNIVRWYLSRMAEFCYAMNWHWLLFFNDTYRTWTVARRDVGPETSLRRNAILACQLSKRRVLWNPCLEVCVYHTHHHRLATLWGKNLPKKVPRTHLPASISFGNLRLRNLVLHSELLLREKLRQIFCKKKSGGLKMQPKRLKVPIWQQMNSACLISNWQLASMPCCANGSSKSTSKKSREATMTKAAFWGSPEVSNGFCAGAISPKTT